MKVISATLFLAIIHHGVVWAQDEDCGPYPTGLNRLFGDATKKFEACVDRRNEDQRNIVEKMKKDMQGMLENSESACKTAIRKLSSRPSTLSFNFVPKYEILNGLNASGFDYTDGGYSLKLSGSDVNGRFRVVCYLDKNYRVTDIR